MNRVTGAGPSTIGRTLIHFGMILATLAFASWWTSHTILDTSRTRRVTTTVLEDADLRRYVAKEIAPVVVRAVGTPSLSTATGANAANAAAATLLTDRLTAVLDRPEIRVQLETFVVDAHQRLIGEGSGPVTLDKATVDALVTAAVPTMKPADLAKIPPVKVAVPQYGALSASRNALARRFPLFALGAIVLLTLAILASRDRRGSVKLVGQWLVGISVAHLFVLWIVPVMIVPRVSHSPWASLVAGVARALNAGIVTGLALLAAAGIVLLFADRFLPAVGAAPAVTMEGITPE